MAEKDSQSNSQEQKQGKFFSQEQYDMLKRCSDEKDMTEWNEWRKKHPGDEILLQKAYLVGAHLEGASLGEAHLEGAVLGEAHLEGASLGGAHLENANLFQAHLENADFFLAHLENANLFQAHLENAKLWETHLEGADLREAHLEDAKLWEAHLEGANLGGAHLEGASFRFAAVDGSTLIASVKLDRFTDFTGVGLNNARVEPGIKQLLEYNIRRLRWEEWYEKHPKLKLLVRPFWLMSDYGRSTERIVFTFFGLALVFANIYYHWARLASPGIVENLLVDRNGVDVQWWLVPLRTLYFSIVTQTTLGFGDMYARAQSICGHILLSLQVILGYVLLGALVTRFAVLFTAGGPAGEFTEKEQKSEQRQ